jgi:LysM domain/Cell Wall Hydrolase
MSAMDMSVNGVGGIGATRAPDNGFDIMGLLRSLTGAAGLDTGALRTFLDLVGMISPELAQSLRQQLGGLLSPVEQGQLAAAPTNNAAASVNVRRGDTLSAIATRAGISLEALLAANPQFDAGKIGRGDSTPGNQGRDPDRISIGERITLPSAARVSSQQGNEVTGSVGGSEQVAPVGQTRLSGNTLSLTQADINNIKRTLQTEWVQSAGNEQAAGIVDTILNRTASGHWGSTVADVVNARNQFSDINGPVSRRDGRNSVDDIPMSRVSQRVSDFVDNYLAQRASGTPSSVGSHLNYANPNYSDARNLPWIMALDGPVLGSRNSIHRHGTVPELQRYRPGEFAVALPGQTVAPRRDGAAPTGGPIDGRIIAAQNGVEIKSPSVRIGNLDPAMQRTVEAVAEAARRLGLPTPVITSGNDSRHRDGSLHYENRALDFRGNNISVAQGIALQNEVRRILGPQYDVIFETFSNRSNNHLHVEFDPR